MSVNISPSSSTSSNSQNIASATVSGSGSRSSSGSKNGMGSGMNGNYTGSMSGSGNNNSMFKPLRWQRPNSVYVDLMDQEVSRDFCLNPVSIADIKSEDDPFFLDLTVHGYPLKDFDTLHVSFPSTLLRRPRTTFIQLVSTLHHETQTLLTEKLASCVHLVVFDDHSTIHHCNQQTSSVILKMLPYLNEINPSFSISFIEGGTSSFNKQSFPQYSPIPLPSFKINKPDDNKENHNNKHPPLKLHIPQINDPRISPNLISSASSTKMFIQSLKKDSIHYSPNSIKKYFVFHTPETLPIHVPKWLSPYNSKSDTVLEKIFEDFETLEALEVRRLEKCLMASNPPSSSEPTLVSQNSHSIKLPEKQSPYNKKLSKIYSLKNLQKEYKPNGHAYESDEDVLVMKNSNRSVDEKLRMDITEELNDSSKHNLIGKLNNLSPELLPVLKKRNSTDSNLTSTCDNFNSDRNDLCNINTNSSEKSSDVEEEIVETPLGNYQMTKGIQSFTKNRYSNILPYEHSRVRLQPSPISEHLTQVSGEGSNLVEFLDKKSINLETDPKKCATKACRTNSNTLRVNDELHTVDEDVGYFSQESSPSRLCSNPVSKGDVLRDFPELESSTEPFNDYFNANYLRLPQINPDFNYIATQAPLVSTIDDFWKVVLSNNLKVIISLNSYDELDMKKWDIYWNSKSIRKHEVQVVNTYEDVFDIPGCILRVIKVSKSDFKDTSPTKRAKFEGTSKKNGTNSHIVYQLQYTKWLDSCGINMKDFIHIYHIKNILLNEPDILINALNNKTEDFLNSYKKLELVSINKNNSGSPILVHCSAGCGRTGVFITLDFLLGVLDPRSNQANKIDVWNMSADLIFIVVNELRKQRISMVQNLTQYLTCYESMLEFFYLKENV